MSRDNLSNFMLFLGFILPFFSLLPEGIGLLAQIGSLVVLSLLALILLGQRRVRTLPLGAMEVILLLIASTSCLAALLSGVTYSMMFALLFAMAVVPAMVITRALPFGQIFAALAFSYAVMVPTSIISDLQGFIIGVSAQHVEGRGLLRFTPFGMHPNLTGYIFGAGAIILWARGSQLSGWQRLTYRLLTGLSISLVLAASSRAGLLALMASLCIGWGIGMFPLTHRRARVLATVSIVIIILGFGTELGTQVIGYVERILDLNSTTRGLDSGGTGRTNLWGQGLDLIAGRDLATILFGTGLRSATAEEIGFSTESSYITIVLECGLPLSVLLIIALIAGALQQVRRGERTSSDSLVIGRLLLFALVQSVFNRYLIAIGNPFSLYSLFLFVVLFRSIRTQSAHGKSGADKQIHTPVLLYHANP